MKSGGMLIRVSVFMSFLIAPWFLNTAHAQFNPSSGPEEGSPLGSGDSIRSSGIGNTTNRPTDDAPRSSHPTEPITDTASEMGHDEVISSQGSISGGAQLRKIWVHDAQLKLDKISDRLLDLENKGGLLKPQLKADFQKDISQVRSEERSLALKVKTVNHDGGFRSGAHFAALDEKMNHLEEVMKTAEKKYLK